MGQVVIKSLQLLHHRHQRPHQHNLYLDLEVTLKVTLCQVCQMVWQCISMENEDNRAFQLENKPFPKSSTLHIQRWLHLIRFNWSGQRSRVMSSNLLNPYGSNLTSLMSLWSLAMASRGLRSCNTRGKLLGKKLQMRNHVEIHDRNFIHVCTFCEKEFGTWNGLQLHVYTIHKDRDNSAAYPGLKEKLQSTEI